MLLLPGLGDALATSPILRGLHRESWTIDAMTMHEPVSEYARALGAVRDIYELPLRPRVADVARATLRVRRNRYDLCVVPFPATRWQYMAIARGAGARRLASHVYGGLVDAVARTGRVTLVPLRGGHRLAENLRLARALGAASAPDDVSYWLPDAWRSPRIPGLLGVHPGSMAYKGNESKRWPYDRFVALVRAQAERGRRVRFFIGPHEDREAASAEKDFRGAAGISIIREPIAQAARALAQCEVFIGNDAGFSHLASGLGVKTLALFGMTSEVRGLPIGPAIGYRPSPCPACHDEGSKGFECVLKLDYRCILRDVDYDAVLGKIEDLFGTDGVAQHVTLEGPFRLYGKAYS